MEVGVVPLILCENSHVLQKRMAAFEILKRMQVNEPRRRMVSARYITEK
jgi:hypothetical protein